ncbi:MAG: 50S ribosomal protein L4 [Phycisphaerae bacterium]
MIEIPVVDSAGKKVGSEQLDPKLLGGSVRYALLKQAVVAYRANRRQGTVATRSRGMVQGSSRKLYRQKGTGRARAGNARTPVRRGGGHTFAKVQRDFSKALPRQMRRLARNSAILAKAISGSALILSDLAFDEPKTRKLAGILKAVDAERGALMALTSIDPNLLKSGRNIAGVGIKSVWEVNAYEILRHRKLIFTPESFKALVDDPMTAGNPEARQ